jgi:hypothetical protein
MGLKGDPSALQLALSKAKGPQDDPLILEKTPRGVSYIQAKILREIISCTLVNFILYLKST